MCLPKRESTKRLFPLFVFSSEVIAMERGSLLFSSAKFVFLIILFVDRVTLCSQAIQEFFVDQAVLS